MRVDSRVGQWVGVAVIVGWCAVLGLLLPRWADGSAPEAAKELAGGQRVAVGGVSVSPADGWSQSTEVTDSLLLSKQDASISFFPLEPAAGSLEDALTDKKAVFESDKSTTYDIGKPQEFSTDSGLKAVQLVVLAPGSANVLYAFSDGKQTVTALMASTDVSWQSLHDEITTMMKSVRFTGVTSPTPSASPS